MIQQITPEAFWRDLLEKIPVSRGSLQKRNGWRLRWREKRQNGRCVHRSKRVPNEEVQMVWGIIRGILTRQQELREQEKRVRKEERDLSRKYRTRRKLLWLVMRGGRGSKRRAVQRFDQLVQKIVQRKSNSLDQMMELTASLTKPLRRGRRKRRFGKSSAEAEQMYFDTILEQMLGGQGSESEQDQQDRARFKLVAQLISPVA